MSARRPIRALPVVALLLILATQAPAPARAADPYTMRTAATYQVAPARESVSVTVKVTFTNTTPDPAGRYSLFSVVPVAVQDGATEVTAEDATGPLSVTVGTGSGGGRVASVHLRSALRYEKSAEFTLAYTLADGANPDVRVRSSAVVVPIWGFGTSGTVTVRLPDGFSIATRGEALEERRDGTEVVLTSGPIDDTARWLALLTATRDSGYVTLRRSVALAGGTVDLQVRAWPDDPAWGRATLDLLAGGFPALQTELDLPYAGIGPLVVTESLPSGSGSISESATPGAQEIAVAYDAPPFTILHQAAHTWLGSALVGERWIREGIASEVAARAARSLGLEVPYDPAQETASRAANALPLDGWGTTDGAGDSAADAYAYAASWDVVNRIVLVVGQEGLREALARAAAGTDAYEPAGASAGGASGTPLPLSSGRFLDQLEAVSGEDLTDLFRARVFTPAEQARLGERAAARADYERLLQASGDWGVPTSIRSMMAGWHFIEAQAAMSAAQAWWPERTSLVEDLRAASLSAPARLAELWRANGADAATRDELTAEAAFVAAYRSADAAIGDDPNPVERLGMLGAQTAREHLARAAGLFAEGDLPSAADEVSAAVAADRDAQAAGVVRLAIGLAVLAVVAAAVTLLVRRLRRPRNAPA